MIRPKNLFDKNLIALYDSARKQTVMGENRPALLSRVIGHSMKNYAEKLRAEMERRK